MKLTKGVVLLDRYEIIEHIGSGGMALVYKAKDLKLERVVAVKTLREEYIADMEFLKRFSSEARAAASLSNANIVNAYDVGADGDVYFIVMEYVDGVTLKELINKRAPFGSEEVLSVAIQIADALSHAHKNGIIHRDIKPQNIIVTKDGVVKVTDFGIARIADAETTTSSGAMGSVHYFSPEQARGKFVDFRSDIYSLGIVMFEMATGMLPFEGDTAVTIALKHIGEPLPDIRNINPDISMSSFKIIRKAAAKNLNQRYASAEGMLKDLKRAMLDDSGRFVKEPIELIGTRKMDTQEIERINKFSDDGEYEGDYYDEHDDYDDDYDPDYEDEDFEELDELDEYEETDEDYERELDKRSERRIIIAAIATGVAIVILITSIGFWIFGRGQLEVPPDEPPDEPTEYTMPSLGGMDIDAARAILESMGVVVGSVEEVYSDTIAEGVIVEYYPSEGTELSYGDEVNITISRGMDRVMVPDMMGELFTNVILMREFADNIFFYEEIEIFDDDLPAGVVVSQEPAAGTYAARGQTIRLEVSMGREHRRVTVPLLLGETEEVAKTRLEDAGLRIGQIAAVYNAEFPAGQVAMQNFAGGVEVSEGTVITFAVSLGPRPDTAPPEPDPPPPEPQPPEPQPPQIPTRTETVLMHAPMEAMAQGPVQIRVDTVSNGVTERVYERGGLVIGNFPLPITVTGTGSFEVRIYVNNQFHSSQMFN